MFVICGDRTVAGASAAVTTARPAHKDVQSHTGSQCTPTTDTDYGADVEVIALSSAIIMSAPAVDKAGPTAGVATDGHANMPMHNSEPSGSHNDRPS